NLKDNRMTNKNVIITGAAKGIGKACVEYFIGQGDHVIALDRDSEGLANLDASSGRLYTITCDVSKSNLVEEAISKAIQNVGEIDILVNSAGIQRYSTVTETTEEEWDMVMNINLKSAFLCSKFASPSMLRKGTGVVINVSSAQAFLSQARVAPYTTA